jgi:hypothetical protein
MDSTEKSLVNRVATSGLQTIDLEKYFPEGDIVAFDLKSYLFMELMLKEKDFREAMKNHDWTQYAQKNVVVFCSTDAIIPVWAWMLVTVNAAPHARTVFQGTTDEFLKSHYENVITQLDLDAFTAQRIVIKGCSNKPVPPAAYVALTKRLQPLATSIMYGEPCSTVPIYKKPK